MATSKVVIPTSSNANPPAAKSVTAEKMKEYIDALTDYSNVDAVNVDAFMDIALFSNLDKEGVKTSAIKCWLSIPVSTVKKIFGIESDESAKRLMTEGTKAFIRMCSDLAHTIFLQRGNNLGKAMTRGTEAIKLFCTHMGNSLSSTEADPKTGARRFKAAAKLRSDDFTFARWAAVAPERLIVIAAVADGYGKLKSVVSDEKMSEDAKKLPPYARILGIATIIKADWEPNYIAFVKDATAVITPKTEGQTQEQYDAKVEDLKNRSETIMKSLFKLRDEKKLDEVWDTAESKKIAAMKRDKAESS